MPLRISNILGDVTSQIMVIFKILKSFIGRHISRSYSAIFQLFLNSTLSLYQDNSALNVINWQRSPNSLYVIHLLSRWITNFGLITDLQVTIRGLWIWKSNCCPPNRNAKKGQWCWCVETSLMVRCSKTVSVCNVWVVKHASLIINLFSSE